MNLENKTNFILPAVVYGLASAVDYSATAIGLSSGQIQEMNPLYNNLIENHGIFLGLLAPKVAMTTCVIGLLKAVNDKKVFNKFNFKSKYALYGGAIATAGVGLSWLI